MIGVSLPCFSSDYNIFSNVSTRPAATAASSKTSPSVKAPVPVLSVLDTKDEYVPSTPNSSVTFPPKKFLVQSPLDKKRSDWEKSLSGRVHHAFEQAQDKAAESIGLKDKSWTMSHDFDLSKGDGRYALRGGTLEGDGTRITPFTREQLKVFKDAFDNTKIEGKSLAEWKFGTPDHAYNGFWYLEGDPALGRGKYVSFEQASLLTDFFVTDEMPGISPEDLERLMLEGLRNQEREANDIVPQEPVADDVMDEELGELGEALSDELNEAATEAMISQMQEIIAAENVDILEQVAEIVTLDRFLDLA